MASSGSTTDDSEDESDTDPVEGTDELKKRKVGNASIAHKRVETSEESSDESGDSPTAGVKKSTPLIMRTPAPTGNFLRICLLYVCLTVLYLHLV